MAWDIVQTEAFELWFLALPAKDQARILAAILQLEAFGPTLPFPLRSAIKGARHALRELRVQLRGRPIRVLYAFDPARTAVLLLGGDKSGDEGWYRRHVPVADDLFNAHLDDLEE